MQRGQDVLFDVNVRKAGAPESLKNLTGVGFNFTHLLPHETLMQFEYDITYL